MTSFGERASAVLCREDLLEALAALEHERWSHWQRYLHSKCIPGDDGSLTIPTELVGRWTAQMSTRYAELSEKEKESDRDQVRQTLDVIRSVMRGLDDI